jgi:CHAT domain-containing protein/Tfp pilus assembly protein PilF
MSYRPTVRFPLTTMVICVFSLMLLPSAKTMHTVRPAQQPTPTADPTLSLNAEELYRDAYALYLSGDVRRALDKYNHALSLYRRADDRAGEAKTLNNMALCYRALGQYEHALDLYQQALTIVRELADRFTEGVISNNIGVVYSSMSRYTEALAQYQRALIMRHETNDRVGEGSTLGSIGDVYVTTGQYEQALDYYLRALTIQREVDDSEAELKTLNGIGLTYQWLGQPDQALDYYHQALIVAQKFGFRRGKAGVLNNMGFAYHSLNQYGQAQNSYEQALAIARETGDRQLEATTLSNIGKVYYTLEQYDLAQAAYRQALTITRAVGLRQLEGKTLNKIGELYRGQNHPAKAVEVLRQALAIQQEVGDHEGEAATLTDMGVLNNQMRDTVGAIASYQRAIDVTENMQSALKIDEFKASFASEHTDIYEQLINLLWDANRFEEAFNYAERARARAFLDQLANGPMNFRAGVPSNMLAQEQSLQSRITGLRNQLLALRNRSSDQQDPDAIAHTQAELTTLEKDYAALLIELKRQSPELATLVSVDVASIPDIQSLLDADTTLIVYFVAQKRTLAFILTRNTFQHMALDISREELTETIAVFRDFARLDDLHPSNLQILYTWLIAPLKAHLRTQTIGIVPHGILHYLPFAALTDGQSYLGADHILFTLPSASVLQYIQQKRKTRDMGVLAIAQSHAAGLPPLGNVDKEAQAIAQLYGIQALVGDAATETAFRTRAGQVAIIHVAAHGQLNVPNPLFSRIALAADKDNDGDLEVHEVYELDLRHADLVVLSACQTQLGDQSLGDDIVGLNRAFIYAGTPTVIASLWSVDDEATAIFMTSFYRHLKDGMGKAEALRAAQAELRADPKYAHPYYWAAFALTGDPGPTTTARQPLPLELGLGAVLAIVMLGMAGALLHLHQRLVLER